MKTTAIALSVVISCALLAACNDDKSAKTPATQVLIKVNGAEVSVHQMNRMLSKLNNLPEDRVQEAKLRIANTLVDQELLMAEAVKAKLDRSPEVLLDLEAARREVLSRAYLDKVTADAGKPTEQQIQLFYDTNPNLFSLRNIYELKELAVPKAAPNFAELAEKLKQTKDLKAAESALRASGMNLQTTNTTFGAEKAPAEVLKRLATAKVGDYLVQEHALGLSLIEVTRVESAPLDMATAKPAIEKMLQGQQRNQVIQKTLADLRTGAQITYQDESLKPQ